MMKKLFPLLFLLLLSWFWLSLCCAVHPSLSPRDDPGKVAALKKELEEAKSWISKLEESLHNKDLNLQERESTICSLQAEIMMLQEKDGAEVKAKFKNIKVRLDMQEAKTVGLERFSKEKGLKLEMPKARAQIIETGEINYRSRAKNVQSHWLPPWAKSTASEIQASLSKRWTDYGQPIITALVEKLCEWIHQVSQKADTVHDWSKHQIDNIRVLMEQKWFRVVKDWEKTRVSEGPEAETSKEKDMKGYKSSKELEIIGPFFQSTEEAGRPCVNRITALVGPNLNQIEVTLKPYTNWAADIYKKSLMQAGKRHHQVSKKAATVYDWSKHHIDNIWVLMEQKWFCVVKYWRNTTVSEGPHAEMSKEKDIKGYKSSKDFSIPRIEKAQEIIEPLVQLTEDTTRPFVNWITVLVGPNIKQIEMSLKPFSNWAADVYIKSLMAAGKCHHQVQSWSCAFMEKHETLALASNKLVWLSASAVLILPGVGIFLFLSSVPSAKKPAKSARKNHGHGHGHHGHKRHQR